MLCFTEHNYNYYLLFFTEHKIYEKSNMTWKVQENRPFPLELFTHDVALMISDVEINQMVKQHHLECEIFINPGKYLTSFYISFIFQKDFAFKEVIDYHLLKFEQSGLLKQLERKYFEKFIQDCAPAIRELNFHATCLAFAVLVFGAIMALLTFVAEKLRIDSALKAVLTKMKDRKRLHKSTQGGQKHKLCSTGDS